HLYAKQDSSTGIITYDHTNSSFSLIREAKWNENIHVDAMMEVLHTHEYIKIVNQHFANFPHLDDFNKFEICKKLIKQLPKETLSKQFVEIMKARKINNEFSKNCQL